MKLFDRAREMAEQTPPHRNRYVDALRAISIVVVVIGHWLMAVFTVQEGRVIAQHLLAEASWSQILTWFFQVMPVFFMVGGYANAASWSAAQRAEKSYADWLRSRCQRLLGPTVVFALVWVPISLFTRLLITDAEVLLMAGKLVAIPLWFMAVYLVTAPVAPAMFALHKRFGAAVPIVLTLAAACVDLLDTTAYVKGETVSASWGWINFAIVWLAVHQIGFLWWDGKLERWRPLKWILAIAGLGGMIALTASPYYGFSMIGVPGEAQNNNTPPTVVLIFLACFQMGVILLTTSWANRRLADTDTWAGIIVMNGMIMTMYLWHCTAMMLAVWLGYAFGYRWPMDPLTGAWWLSRIGWVILLAGFLVVFVVLFGRFERPRPAAPVGKGVGKALLAGAGAVLAAAGLAGIAIKGLCLPGDFWGFPFTALVFLVIGSAATGVSPALYGKKK